MLAYTICFIKRKNDILLLNREAPAWMGVWNGVGGKLEPGETPRESILREVKEETGIQLDEGIRFKGVVTWTVDQNRAGGMYLYFAEVEDHFEYATPLKTEEGILDWKDIDWILHRDNVGVATNIVHFLPLLLRDSYCYEHFCDFRNGRIVHTECERISNDVEQRDELLRELRFNRDTVYIT